MLSWRQLAQKWFYSFQTFLFKKMMVVLSPLLFQTFLFKKMMVELSPISRPTGHWRHQLLWTCGRSVSDRWPTKCKMVAKCAVTVRRPCQQWKNSCNGCKQNQSPRDHAAVASSLGQAIHEFYTSIDVEVQHAANPEKEKQYMSILKKWYMDILKRNWILAFWRNVSPQGKAIFGPRA